ncbi:hypothetical protein DFH09DRAFT_42251 [Mycena vulgaris]|nr:hypothetical protein DFH09DRAFT_42251 [Mycena vulgaris]
MLMQIGADLSIAPSTRISGRDRHFAPRIFLVRAARRASASAAPRNPLALPRPLGISCILLPIPLAQPRASPIVVHCPGLLLCFACPCASGIPRHLGLTTCTCPPHPRIHQPHTPALPVSRAAHHRPLPRRAAARLAPTSSSPRACCDRFRTRGTWTSTCMRRARRTGP